MSVEREVCDECSGKGYDGETFEDCPWCGGRGFVPDPDPR